MDTGARRARRVAAPDAQDYAGTDDRFIPLWPPAWVEDQTLDEEQVVDPTEDMNLTTALAAAQSASLCVLGQEQGLGGVAQQRARTGVEVRQLLGGDEERHPEAARAAGEGRGVLAGLAAADQKSPRRAKAA